uniref:beta-N-acetylhexosaminidase n=1 Tax=Populus alba TaxID=43335 RepID=A0A4U5MAV5_POPAL|nr:glycosyl hydrolase family 20 family protein [Populus alba]
MTSNLVISSRCSLFLLLFFLLVSASLTATSAQWVSPKPRTLSWPIPLATILSPNFTISSPYHQHLSLAVNRYRLQILTEHHHPLVPPPVNLSNSSPPLQALTITVKDLAAPLQHSVDESYALAIPTASSTANLTAETVWGAMRGLETFSQLVWGSKSLLVPVGLDVWDSPLFEHRGIMLDTSRNYYPVDDILRTIKAMSANKLNNSMKKVQESMDIKVYMQGPAGKKFKAVALVAVSNRVHPHASAALQCFDSIRLNSDLTASCIEQSCCLQ